MCIQPGSAISPWLTRRVIYHNRAAESTAKVSRFCRIDGNAVGKAVRVGSPGTGCVTGKPVASDPISHLRRACARITTREGSVFKSGQQEKLMALLLPDTCPTKAGQG